MIELKIAITALVLGIFSWIGMNVFDDLSCEGVATLCAGISTICGIVFVISIVAWAWGL